MFDIDSRVRLKVSKSFNDGQVVLPAGSLGTVRRSGPTITGVEFDNDTGDRTFRVVRNRDLEEA